MPKDVGYGQKERKIGSLRTGAVRTAAATGGKTALPSTYIRSTQPIFPAGVLERPTEEGVGRKIEEARKTAKTQKPPSACSFLSISATTTTTADYD